MKLWVHPGQEDEEEIGNFELNEQLYCIYSVQVCTGMEHRKQRKVKEALFNLLYCCWSIQILLTGGTMVLITCCRETHEICN